MSWHEFAGGAVEHDSGDLHEAIRGVGCRERDVFENCKRFKLEITIINVERQNSEPYDAPGG